jgi:hypothetical protein
VGEGVQEFLEDYALLAEVFVIVAREVALLRGGGVAGSPGAGSRSHKKSLYLRLTENLNAGISMV